MTSVSVLVQRLDNGCGLPLPTYATENAAGMDIYAAVSVPIDVPAGEVALIPTGLAIAIPQGHEGQLRPRSGMAARDRVTLANSPATIDADYRGEIFVAVLNFGREKFTISRGMRIAQLIVMPVPHVNWQEVDALPRTERDTGGFGHTGA
jgi:dUTP pyrophosphatase